MQAELPNIAFALLSGLNAATVGLVALAAVQLSERAITNNMERFILSTTACVGILYSGHPLSFSIDVSALWYYPVLMVGSGIALVIYDSRVIQNVFRRTRSRFQRNHREENVELGTNVSSQEHEMPGETSPAEPKPIRIDASDNEISSSGVASDRQRYDIHTVDETPRPTAPTARVRSEDLKAPYSILIGVSIFALFVVSFIVIMVIRGVVPNLPKPYQFFANMYLAGMFMNRFILILLGTIIFGSHPFPYRFAY